MGGPIDPAVLGFVMQVHCPRPGPDGTSEVTAVDHVKVFRNREDLRFEGRIHEQILPAIRRAEGDVVWTDLFVVHSGSDHSPLAQSRKLERDFRLLELDLRERPDHPFVLFNLGMTHLDAGNSARAAEFLERTLAVSGAFDSHVRKAYALLAASYSGLGREREALAVCRDGLARFPKDPELRFRLGLLAHRDGKFDEAERAYRAILGDQDVRHFSSIDRDIGGIKTRQNLAVLYHDMGRFDAAEAEWRCVRADRPRYAPALIGLCDCLVRQGKLAEAESEAEQAEPVQELRDGARAARAKVASARGESDGVRRALEACSEGYGDPEALADLCRFLFERGRPADAERRYSSWPGSARTTARPITTSAPSVTRRGGTRRRPATTSVRYSFVPTPPGPDGCSIACGKRRPEAQPVRAGNNAAPPRAPVRRAPPRRDCAGRTRAGRTRAGRTRAGRTQAGVPGRTPHSFNTRGRTRRRPTRRPSRPRGA